MVVFVVVVVVLFVVFDVVYVAIVVSLFVVANVAFVVAVGLLAVALVFARVWYLCCCLHLDRVLIATGVRVGLNAGAALRNGIGEGVGGCPSLGCALVVVGASVGLNVGDVLHNVIRLPVWFLKNMA